MAEESIKCRRKKENGVVFDIKEFAVFDGPGIRTTVFLKGCPLRCRWCHNPEGLSPEPEVMASQSGCLNCGKCREVCTREQTGQCILCGKCVAVCPLHLRRIAGTEYTPEELAYKLKKNREIYVQTGGGITFSGGEPLLQYQFLLRTAEQLAGIHLAIETSGYADEAVFREVVDQMDFVMMDIKFADEKKHQEYTSVSNRKIMKNLEYLKRGSIPFVIRIPLIPGVNDNCKNLEMTAELIKGSPALQRVEMLPYHMTAGAKYPMVRREYKPGFDESRTPKADMEPFLIRKIPCNVL